LSFDGKHASLFNEDTRFRNVPLQVLFSQILEANRISCW